MTRIAQISCGTEYSGIQWLLNKAAEESDVILVYPEVELADVEPSCEELGLKVDSSSLNLMIARARSVIEDPTIDGVFLLTCFKCAEGAIVKNEIRKFLQERRNIPVITYSNVEKPKFVELYARMEALNTIITRKMLLMRERQEGITMGIDSGSSTTKAVIMEENEIIGKGWIPTTDVVESAEKAMGIAMEDAGIDEKKIEAIGITGYGRGVLTKRMKPDLSLEEISVVSKGAVFLGNLMRGEATVIDIGGMDNKVILLRDGMPDTFTLGGICGGSSGRFLEVTSRRLDMDISELGKLALKARSVYEMKSYCMVFGIQDLVVSLASGVPREDVAMAACRSVVNQIYENQLQEVSIRTPVILVGGVSLIEGVVKAFEDVLGMDVAVPPDSQYAGAVGMAILVSGFVGEEK